VNEERGITTGCSGRRNCRVTSTWARLPTQCKFWGDIGFKNKANATAVVRAPGPMPLRPERFAERADLEPMFCRLWTLNAQRAVGASRGVC